MVAEEPSRRTVIVNLRDGLHLRPISQIVEVVRRRNCRVRIAKGELWADASNVLDIIPLHVEFGTTLTLEAVGENALDTLEELVRLFESNFDEPTAD